MAEYLVDEFIDGACDSTFEEQVDKKVSLLYDMCILTKRKNNAKDRERAVRQLLSSCKSERSMDNTVHDLVVGKCTLEDILKRKGYLQ